MGAGWLERRLIRPQRGDMLPLRTLGTVSTSHLHWWREPWVEGQKEPSLAALQERSSEHDSKDVGPLKAIHVLTTL